MTKDEAKKVLLAITDVILETIEDAGPRGVPAGPLYAALMPMGMRLEHFQSIMGALVQAGKVSHSHHVYTTTRKEIPA